MRALSLAQELHPLLYVEQHLRQVVHSLARSVDDLKDISSLDKYIARAMAVLIFCTDGYTTSRNCMIELRSSVQQDKLIIPVVDPDAKRGGLTEEQVQEQLVKAENDSFVKWGFGDQGPSAEKLFAALFAAGPIEWNRIGPFQDV